ncbi:MAG: hypothetical protein ACRDOO_04365 [Actinomadura sp.]
MAGTTIEPAQIAGDARVRPRALSMRAEGEAWVIGRPETGDFISVPAAGHRAVILLSEGHTVDQVRHRLHEETGTDLDVARFVAALAGLGFIAAVDDRSLGRSAPPAASLSWLTPRHTRWLLHPATAVSAAVLVAVAFAVMLADPAVVPHYKDLLWSGHGSAVIVGNAAIAWSIIWIHEFAHLATARAVGVPARMSLGTRLQFLAAQTDVSGVWAHPRRTRIAVYLAGLAVQLVIAAIGVLALSLAGLPDLAHRLVAATVLLSVLSIPYQLLIFMRTDLYFVVQDLAGCANLYADGTAYLLYQAKRIKHVLRPATQVPADPSRSRSRGERRAIRAYSLILVTGTAVCLGVAAVITLPVTITLLTRALTAVVAGTSVVELLDGVAVLVVVGGVQLLWARMWWRGHRHQVGSLLRSRRRTTVGR